MSERDTIHLISRSTCDTAPVTEIRHDGYVVLADRTHHYKLPLDLLFAAVTDARTEWLQLAPGEVMPQVLEAIPLRRVVWSSFWPVSPDDIIELDLSSQWGPESQLRVRWLSRTPPDERGIGITRQRLNRKFGGDIRGLVHLFSWGTW